MLIPSPWFGIIDSCKYLKMNFFYNVYSKILSEIKYHSPDILYMQEVQTPLPANDSSNHLYPFVDKLPDYEFLYKRKSSSGLYEKGSRNWKCIVLEKECI